jgi:flagellar protein FlaG
MELMQNVAKMQNSQINSSQQSSSVQMQQHQAQAIEQANINQQKSTEQSTPNSIETHKVDSQQDMEDLVKELNRALNPFNTSLRFGFDNSSEDFFVSVIESQTNRMIRRFPAEKAAQFLPKIQEVNGFLFDEKG